jgi:peptidoglycan/xylan/chitin deacetylase (PgdA/CDA1 family)
MDKSKFHLITYNWLFLLFVFLFLYFWQHISVGYIVGLVAAWLLTVAAGSLFLRWNFYLEAIRHGSRRVKQVALTFDDGPSVQTETLLKILKQENVPAAFFLKGENITMYRKIVRKAFDENHLLGNHSFSHNVKFTFQNSKSVGNDLLKTSEMIEKITGKKPLFFRPPFGVTNPEIAKAVNESGLTVVGWSVRSFDTRYKNPDKLLKRLKQKTRSGDIVLLHDYPEVTLKMLPQYIGWLKQNGFQIVSLEQLINKKAYA